MVIKLDLKQILLGKNKFSLILFVSVIEELFIFASEECLYTFDKIVALDSF